ncbi:MAG TPA: phosphatase PAP2 family protein [Bryobacteraceae bacterium]|nr:phosphatase PAP2 family protein [Bryobacteraceae bacterium]
MLARGALIAFLLIPLAGLSGFAQQPSGDQTEDSRDRIYYPGDTERVKPLARKLLSNIWLDQKTIWTSPFHADREEKLEWLGFTAATAALVVTDRRTSHLFENSKGQVTSGNYVSKLGSAYTVLPEVAGFYLYGVFTDNEKARETGVLGSEALIDALIVSEVFKVAVGRNRPNAPSKPGDFFQGGASFPSGHSIESWALASVIAHEYRNKKWVPWVAYGLAGVVGSARFAARQHYASDIFAGSVMGYFIGRYVVNTHEAHAGHHHGVITPIMQPSTRTFGLGVRFGM